MFCLRSWLPLLFIPTNASPAFIFLFFVCTYFLNRPCVYCSFLLLVLFLTSCNWSDHCFFDFASNWFLPRPGGSFLHVPLPFSAGGDAAPNASCAGDLESTASVAVAEMVNTTARALAGVVSDNLGPARTEWTGLGIEWLRSLLGKREWRIDCLDVYIRL